MVKTKGLGFVLLGVSLIALFVFTPFGQALFSGFDDFVSGNGKSVSCDVTVDFNSINNANCNSVNQCRITNFFALNPFITKNTLRLTQSGIVYKSKDFDINKLGVDKKINIDACVPGNSNSIRLELVNKDGVVVDEEVKNI